MIITKICFVSWSNRLNPENKSQADIFTLKYAIFPTHDPSLEHWFLLVASMQERKILYIDSLYDVDRGLEYAKWLQSYIFAEYKARHDDMDMPQDEQDKWTVECVNGNDASQQGNGFDCGMYASAFAYCLLHDLPTITFAQGDMNALRMKFVYCILQESKN